MPIETEYKLQSLILAAVKLSYTDQSQTNEQFLQQNYTSTFMSNIEVNDFLDLQWVSSSDVLFESSLHVLSS